MGILIETNTPGYLENQYLSNVSTDCRFFRTKILILEEVLDHSIF